MNLFNVIRSVINMLIPGTCINCSCALLSTETYLCKKCFKKLLSCKAPSYLYTQHISTLWSLQEYNNIIKKCITYYKTYRYIKIYSIFHLILVSFLKTKDISGYKLDMVIPVPLHISQYNKRGFNQAELLSKDISRLLSIKHSDQILIKVKNTADQKMLSKAKRLKNLKSAFAIKNRDLIRGKNILITDDIVTTGATLELCAKMLLRNGARKVHALTIARVLQ